MRVLVKEGAIFKEINERLFHVCISAWMVYQKYGVVPVITSANDSKHSQNSLHYKNLAWDLRVWGLPDPQAVVKELIAILNVKYDDYDVIFENDHIHIEWDKKGNAL